MLTCIAWQERQQTFAQPDPASSRMRSRRRCGCGASTSGDTSADVGRRFAVAYNWSTIALPTQAPSRDVPGHLTVLKQYLTADKQPVGRCTPLPALVERGPCPLCAARDPVIAIAFNDVPLVRCGECGFLYSGRVMSEHELASYYAHQVSNERLKRGQQVFAQASLRALERLTTLSRIRRALDVGAGYGYLLSDLRRCHGISGMGVEPSEIESDHARTRLGVDVRTSVLANAGLEPASFDLVYTFEVLEHTLHPRLFIAELAEYVAPGGFLVVGTDNFESAVVRALGPAFPKWIPHTHISHFSPSTLTRLMRQLGGFDVSGYLSYTPWEFIARSAVSSLRPTRPLSEAYDLASGIRSEVSRSFKLYRLRKAITTPWFWLNAKPDLSGEMMFISLRKRPS